MFKGTTNNQDGYDYNRSFTFHLDTTTLNSLTESKLIYGTWDYIYEIGGWIGLFLGYSVIDIFDIIVDFFARVINNSK